MAANYYFVSEGLVVKMTRYDANGNIDGVFNIDKRRFVNVLALDSTNVKITLTPAENASTSGVSGVYNGNSLTMPYTSIYIASSVQSSALGAATNLRTLVANTVTIS
jgi:hypothetical protein